MPQAPHKHLLNPDQLFASRELRFQAEGESQYPELQRLCADFHFSVLQLQRKLFSHLSRKTVPGAPEFVLATRDESDGFWYSFSPSLSSLKGLNDYAKRHQVDLLHLQLFGDDIDLEQFSDGFY